MNFNTHTFFLAARSVGERPTAAPRPPRKGCVGWLPGLLLLGLLFNGAAAGAAGVQYFGNAGAHNLYVRNEDGNLFRWGEPRYGQHAAAQSPILIPYYESMITVPPSPSGAKWQQAFGVEADELFLDEAGRVFANRVALNKPTRLIEIVHPSPYRKWFRVASSGSLAVLIDDAGELFELPLNMFFQQLAGDAGEAPSAPSPWLRSVARPNPYHAILDVFASYGFTLVRTAAGEIYGRGFSSAWLTGSEAVAGGDWQRVVRPAGVNSWRTFSASPLAAVAMGDDGQAYYWGLRIPGTTTADPAADSRIPARITAPAGVSGWKSGSVVGALVLLVSEDGQLFGFGSGSFGLQAPLQWPDSQLLLTATPASNPLLQGEFDSVLAGSDYLIARRSDGTDVRWGQFMRLESVWFPGDRPPEIVDLPATVTGIAERLAPAARVLNPASFSRVGVGQSTQLAAEVFPLAGTLSSVQFILNNQLLGGTPQINGLVATLAWPGAGLGEHSLKVRAVDSAGRVTLSPPVAFRVRHAVEWAISTNRISEAAGNGLGTFAELVITRTEQPYPNYHAFSYRFRIAPRALLDKDFSITGAALAEDASGDWEVRFAPGQKTATVRITALEDQFSEPVLGLALGAAPDWAMAHDYTPPAALLELEILDATSIDGPSPVFIVEKPETRFSFVGGVVPVTVSVPKSLTELPIVELLLVAPGYFPRQLTSIEELSDRWLYHFNILNLPAGLHDVTARVRDGSPYGYSRYRDSSPVALRVWDTAGLATVRVVASEQIVNEADEPAWSFTLMREGPLNEAIEVGLEVRGTALGGSDYDELPGSVAIPAGIGYVQVPLRIHDDARAEFDETIIISARQQLCEQLAGCAVALTDSALRVRIRDDDGEAPVTGGAQVVASPFSDGSYLLTASGQLYAWGDNQQGSLGLGNLPPELADRVPWPRRLRGLADGEHWQRVLVGPKQAFGVSDQGGLYAWGAGFAGYNQVFGIPTPRPVTAAAGEAEPFYVQNGALITRQDSGRLQTYRVTSYQPHQLYALGDMGLSADRVTPQLRVLSDEGYFHEASDWLGLHADRYPLAPGAGYWKDVASSGGVMVALDELDRLFLVNAGDIQYDPALGRTRRYYTTEALPALPVGRTVSQLFGNDLGLVALATDGAAFTLQLGTNGGPGLVVGPIAFPAGVSRWSSLAAGKNHFLAVGDDGRVYSWGGNEAGQLGDGATEPVESPRALPAFTDVNNPAVEFPIVDLARPPLVNFYAMETTYHLGGPETIRASARAYDPDGLIERVEFLLNGEVAAVATFDFELGAFVADVFVPHPGEYVFTARAWDDSGLSGEAEGIAIHVDDPGRYPVVKVWNIPSGTAEGFGFPGYFVISRQGIADVPLTVYFDIHGTATEGTDYPALPRSVIIPAGAAEVRLPVIARPDFIDEDTEEVNLTILNPGCNPDTAEPGSGCYRIAQPATAPVFIVDYLLPGDAFLSFVSLRLLNSPIVREGRTNVAVIEARRYGVTVEDLAVHYELGGTAENGVDYQPLSGVVVIPAGADRATFAIAPIEDTLTESFERVIVTVKDAGCGPASGPVASCYLSDPANSLVVFVGDKQVLPPLPNSVPRPVLFDDIVLFPGEGTLLSVMGDPGAEFVLEVSADLVNWEPLSELMSGSGRVEFFDVDAAGAGRRFYRLVAPASP